MQFEVSATDLSEVNSLIELLDKHAINKILITNKKRIDDYSICTSLKRFNPAFVYSMEVNYSSQTEETFNNFRRFIESTQSFATEYLIVSGGTRKRVDTIKALDYLTGNKLSIPISVAYNPYLSSDDEDERLLKKLSYPFVKKVYIQIGEDLDKLRRGVELIRSIRADIDIATCILIPNRNLLSRFRFRPWRGVYLSEKYLNDVDYANEFTGNLILESMELKIDKLIEIIPFNIKNIEEYRSRFE